MTKGNRLYVPKGGDLRKSLISECHDTLWAGHPEKQRTYAGRCRDPQNTLRRKETAHLFFKHVVKYWGLPKDIVSDRDSRFTGVFWTELFRLLGSTLSMSSSYHPQSDGQTERFNSMLEEYLRHFVRATAPPSHSRLPQGVRSPLARSFSQEWKQNVEIARSCLEKAQKRMKKYADNNRRFVEFNAGDLVMVKVPDPRLSKSSRGRDPRLMQKQGGRCPQSAQPPQLELTKTKEKVAEAILNHRVTSTAKRTHNEYLVKWKGCSSEENTWERVTNLKAFLPLVEAYHASHAPRTSPSQVGRMSRDARTLGTLDAHSATQPLNSADQQPSPTDAGLPQS
ncbi:UNVERIFIED_CONTAM: hypothetical protein Sangu_1167700 [Sesamum angustifolium]|uniref:Reverse transcriptase n=1 Tax=Sesamum angustifolium TaxID=2727405 RepID=A0AAW2P075_9LAMI